ncbi:hypothetical protein ABZ702_04030 [Streptomyces cyaneofuscatus]
MTGSEQRAGACGGVRDNRRGVRRGGETPYRSRALTAPGPSPLPASTAPLPSPLPGRDQLLPVRVLEAVRLRDEPERLAFSSRATVSISLPAASRVLSITLDSSVTDR